MIVDGIVFNLEPNSHFGFHVHEQGDITNACESTGAHFNPYGRNVKFMNFCKKKSFVCFFLAW